jgi:hypothetical protein
MEIVTFYNFVVGEEGNKSSELNVNKNSSIYFTVHFIMKIINIVIFWRSAIFTYTFFLE